LGHSVLADEFIVVPISGKLVEGIADFRWLAALTVVKGWLKANLGRKLKAVGRSSGGLGSIIVGIIIGIIIEVIVVIEADGVPLLGVVLISLSVIVGLSAQIIRVHVQLKGRGCVRFFGKTAQLGIKNVLTHLVIL